MERTFLGSARAGRNGSQAALPDSDGKLPACRLDMLAACPPRQTGSLSSKKHRLRLVLD